MRLGPRARCSIRSTSDSSLPAGPQARYKGKTNAGPSAMANDTLINLLAWCKRERERLQMQREMLQSGRFRIFEKDDSDQQRDISNQHIEQIAANISELDRIITADYESKSVYHLPNVSQSSAPQPTSLHVALPICATRVKQMQDLVPWPMAP